MAGIYIVSDLGGSTYISVYAMVSFGLGNVLSIPLADPLADRLGPIKLLVYALLLYTLFSILCGLASTFIPIRRSSVSESGSPPACSTFYAEGFFSLLPP